MTETASISRGSIGGPWRIAARLPNGTLPDLPGDYTCKLKVLGSSIERTITTVVADDDGTPNKRFFVNLTKEETASLTVGSFYRRVIQIESVSAGICEEDNLDFTVTPGGIDPSDPFTPPTTLDFLKGLRDNIRIQMQESIGGIATEVWNGRYGNKVKYQAMTYPQLRAELANVEAEIAAEERVAAGGSRRAHTLAVWKH